MAAPVAHKPDAYAGRVGRVTRCGSEGNGSTDETRRRQKVADTGGPFLARGHDGTAAAAAPRGPGGPLAEPTSPWCRLPPPATPQRFAPEDRVGTDGPRLIRAGP